MNNEQEIKDRMSTYRTVTNRLNRYWKKLVLEGLREAQQKGIETLVTESNLCLHTGIIVKKEGDLVDASEIIEIAREKWPVLYRKYNRDKETQKRVGDELRRDYESL